MKQNETSIIWLFGIFCVSLQAKLTTIDNLKNMRTKTSKVVIMLFIALLQCSVAFSATDATTPVLLYYYKYNPPVVDGTSRPRKNPPHQLTLSVLFDHDNGQLIFEDPQGASCSYSVVCADGSIVTEGFLDFEIQKVAYAYLIGLNPGSYTLIVEYGDYEYHGVIEL